MCVRHRCAAPHQNQGEVWAPTTKYQLHGITRAHVLRLCEEHGIPVRETDFSLTKVYSADEAFVTGTFAGQVPVVSVDGRVIGDGKRGPLVTRLQELYRCVVAEGMAVHESMWQQEDGGRARRKPQRALIEFR